MDKITRSYKLKEVDARTGPGVESTVRRYVEMYMGEFIAEWTFIDTQNLLIWRNYEPTGFGGTWCSPGTFGATYGEWSLDGDTIIISTEPDEDELL